MKSYRILKYHQITWSNRNFTFEKAISEAFRAISNRPERLFPVHLFSEHLYFSCTGSADEAGIFVRIFEIPKNGLHDIDLNAQSDEVCLGEVNGTNERKIVTDQILLWVKANDVISCNAGNKLPSVVQSMKEFFRAAGLIEDDLRFEFLDVPNRDLKNEIKSHGVSRIDLNITHYAASMPQAQADNLTGFF